jgi:hypothetical protein
VQPDRRQAGLLDEVVELVGQVGRGQRLAVLMSEDPALGRGASLAEVAFLPTAMGAEDNDRLRVQGDPAAAGFRLQRARLQLTVGPLLELPCGRRRPGPSPGRPTSARAPRRAARPR